MSAYRVFNPLLSPFDICPKLLSSVATICEPSGTTAGRKSFFPSCGKVQATRPASPGWCSAFRHPTLFFYATPAVLWPRIIVAKSGYNLADSGAIDRNGFHEEDAARARKSRARVDDGSHIARFHRQSKPYAHTEWA